MRRLACVACLVASAVSLYRDWFWCVGLRRRDPRTVLLRLLRVDSTRVACCLCRRFRRVPGCLPIWRGWHPLLVLNFPSGCCRCGTPSCICPAVWAMAWLPFCFAQSVRIAVLSRRRSHLSDDHATPRKPLIYKGSGIAQGRCAGRLRGGVSNRKRASRRRPDGSPSEIAPICDE